MDILTNISLNTYVVSDLLKNFDQVFCPSISKEIDLEAYSSKLSKNAHFILVRQSKDNKVIGFIAYYTNQTSHFFYIPLIAVIPEHQHDGIGRIMMNLLKSTMADKDVNEIRLEVNKNNLKGHAFYIKNGFRILEDRGSKYLMAYEARIQKTLQQP